MKKKLLYSMLLGMFILPNAWGADYGLPTGIQEGNILHCFNWPAKEVKAALPQIAAAGFGSVQLSPLQRPDAGVGSPWHDLYRPYDLAFKSSSYCSEQDLKDLCSEAANYGIKIIVDIVANHVDKTAGYHDSWWDSNGRVRWNGDINYGDRYSITHGQLGDYGDVNSESAEVCARGKAYVEKLKSLGVKGCRWDAAKHIGLPSEGCNFWSSVTSVSGMYHYGEILDNPGPNPAIIKEYTNYMSVTDNEYCNYAAKSNGGIPGGYGGSWVVNQGCPDTKMVYWAESHDTYSNDEWSQNVDQATIDRAYAAYACRNGATALYLSRPNAKGFSNIKVGKGSTAFTSKHITEVNKFRNLMVGKKDWFEQNGNACSITRDGGGAVIVMKGSGNVSITNGGGFCPAGTYTDRVSGGTFTVTSSTISGNVGSSGIAVLVKDGVGPDPNPNPNPNPDPNPGSSMYILGNIDGMQWTPNQGAEMIANGTTYTAKNVKLTPAPKETNCFFNITDALGADWDALNAVANRYGAAVKDTPITPGTPVTVTKYANDVNASACESWSIAPGSYDFTFDLAGMKLTVVKAGENPDPNPNPNPNPGTLTITGDYNLAYSGTKENVHYWGGTASTWPGVKMEEVKGSDGNTYKVAKVPEGTTGIVFNTGGDANKTGDLSYTGEFVMNDQGATTTAVIFRNGDDPEPTKPVVTANPASGTSFTETLNVTLTVAPEATIYYTLDGTAATESSTKYTAPISLSATTTISTLAVTAKGGKNAQTFSYTKSNGPTPPPVPQGDNLITDYYKVNPDGKVGTYRTVNMAFSNQKSTTAMTNWSDADLIAQGVARDVCQAFKGVHERPIVDSYSLYASYDNENLYLGVQFVYTVWDLGGEGKQPGESKPYNMDGHMVWAFDLDPAKSFDGYINGAGPIWNEGAKGAKFNNGVDAVLMCSTKPGVGTPGLFIPTSDGHASYDAAFCKGLPGGFYGYADGLLPSISHVWGQSQFGYDPEALKGNTGFVDLRSQIDDSAHTFYEFKIPLSLLGITADYIKNTGIGVMYLDKYGTSPVGGTPYDPSYFDNVSGSYSQDPSSSQEKEDEDVITYKPARIGNALSVGVDEEISADVENAAEPVYYNLQGVRVVNPGAGLYIVVRGNKVSKEYIR